MKNIAVTICLIAVTNFCSTGDFEFYERVTGQAFDGVILKNQEQNSRYSATPSKEDVLLFENLLPGYLESGHEPKGFASFNEFKRYYLADLTANGDQTMEVWFIHESRRFIKKGKWLNKHIHNNVLLDEASYLLGFNVQSKTFYDIGL